MLRIREPCLPAPRSSFGEMSTDLHRAVGDLGPPVLEARFHYQPSMGTTDYTLVLIGFPWVPNEGEQYWGHITWDAAMIT